MGVIRKEAFSFHLIGRSKKNIEPVGAIFVSTMGGCASPCRASSSASKIAFINFAEKLPMKQTLPHEKYLFVADETRPRVDGSLVIRRALAMLAALAALAAWPAFAADLEVAVDAVRGGEGQVKMMLFEREEGFRKEDKARQVLALPAAIGTVSGVFRELPPGRYAVIAYHDENGDGKLNLRFGMFPKEGYGLSNNPKLSGPPKFKDAAFDVTEAGIRVGITLNY